MGVSRQDGCSEVRYSCPLPTQLQKVFISTRLRARTPTSHSAAQREPNAQNAAPKPSVPSRTSCHGLASKALLHGFDRFFPELRSNLKRRRTSSRVTQPAANQPGHATEGPLHTSTGRVTKRDLRQPYATGKGRPRSRGSLPLIPQGRHTTHLAGLPALSQTL